MTPYRRVLPLVAAAVSSLAAFASTLAAAERLTLNFNPDWRFLKDDPAGAQAPGFDDHAWSAVSAPHTFNDTDTFDNWSQLGHVGEQEQWSGRTWYRKTFTAPEAWRGKKVYLEFEAVRQVAERAAGLGLGTAGVVASPLPGPSGNVEYFLWLRAGAPEPDPAAVDRAVAEGPR